MPETETTAYRARRRDGEPGTMFSALVLEADPTVADRVPQEDPGTGVFAEPPLVLMDTTDIAAIPLRRTNDLFKRRPVHMTALEQIPKASAPPIASDITYGSAASVETEIVDVDKHLRSARQKKRAHAQGSRNRLFFSPRRRSAPRRRSRQAWWLWGIAAAAALLLITYGVVGGASRPTPSVPLSAQQTAMPMSLSDAEAPDVPLPSIDAAQRLRRSYQRGDWKQAYDAGRDLEETSSLDDDTAYLTAHAARLIGKKQEALERLRALTAAFPQSPHADDALFWQGKILFHTGEILQSRAYFAAVAGDARSDWQGRATLRLRVIDGILSPADQGNARR